MLTRPFGATFGDVLTKPLEKGGLDFGSTGSSLILFSILACLVTFFPAEAPDGARALIGTPASVALAGGDATTSAYPRLLRIFTGSIAIAVLCGFAAVAMEGSKGLHPAPFLAMAAPCAITPAFSFVAMLPWLLVEPIGFLRR